MRRPKDFVEASPLDFEDTLICFHMLMILKSIIKYYRTLLLGIFGLGSSSLGLDQDQSGDSRRIQIEPMTCTTIIKT